MSEHKNERQREIEEAKNLLNWGYRTLLRAKYPSKANFEKAQKIVRKDLENAERAKSYFPHRDGASFTEIGLLNEGARWLAIDILNKIKSKPLDGDTKPKPKVKKASKRKS